MDWLLNRFHCFLMIQEYFSLLFRARGSITRPESRHLSKLEMYGSEDTKPMYWQGSIRSTERMHVLIFDVGKQEHGTTVV